MENGKKKRTPAKKTPTTKIRPDHRAVIDEYFANGFNGTKAVLAIKPDTEYQQARNLAYLILNSDKNRQYIQEKQTEQGRKARIETPQIVQELKQMATADIGDYIGLSLEEIKALPPEIRRPLKRVQIKEKTYRYKDGSEATEKTVQYELEDRLKALNLLAKYVGMYEADNKQKATRIQLNQLNTHELNTLLNVVTTATQQEDHEARPPSLKPPHEATE